MSNSRYSEAERAAAIARAAQVGPLAAARELGIPESTLYRWRNQANKANASNAAVDQAVPAPAAPEPASKPATRVAKSYTPSLRGQILEYAAQHGVTAAANKFGATRFAIYDWQRKVALNAEGKSNDNPITGSDEHPATERERRILAEWKSHPGLGPSQVKNQLRRQGFKVSVHTVRHSRVTSLSTSSHRRPR